MTENSIPTNYPRLLGDLKSRIRNARVRAALAANAELISLYWDIGRLIVERQAEEAWGKGIVDLLSADLRREFDGMDGLSASNLRRMRRFYIEWSQSSVICAQPVRKLPSPDETGSPIEDKLVGNLLPDILREVPWGHNITLMEKLTEPEMRLWYARMASQNGWSRAILQAQIESGLWTREGAAPTNFARTLPNLESDLARSLFKDPYLLDFVIGKEQLSERDLEDQIASHITQFLIELGNGFAYVGRQYPIKVEDEEYFIDLLFYHLHLHCYVVIDLKMTKFQPEFAGKMNFYLEAVDRQVRRSPDSQSIGLILCKEHKRLVVEYALARSTSPLGVSAWQMTRKLPKELRGELPSAEEFQEGLGQGVDDLGEKPAVGKSRRPRKG